MRRTLSVVMLLLATAIAANAQENKPGLVIFGNDTPDERASVRIGYWNPTARRIVGQFAIDYGRPAWKQDYEDAAKFDAMTKGKVWRLGSNFWTTLDTSLPIRIGGQAVPAGLWYLGVHRSDDGATWSLVFIDPAKARAEHIDAFDINRAPIAFRAPLTHGKAAQPTDKLTISLPYKRDVLREAGLQITWGTLQLTAPITVDIN